MITEDNIKLILGLKIKLLRQEKGLSLSNLSEKTKISISYLNEIEKGKKYPKTDKISQLAEALGVSYDWLVSLKLSKKLGPLAEILKSNILNELPLDVFGLHPSNLLELISGAPAKLNAFISTLIEISRNYNLTVENFYSSVLRTYQEMHENYFPEIESEAERFRERYLNNQKDILSAIWDYIEQEGCLEIDQTTLASYPSLKNFRSVLKTGGEKNQLLLNGRLTDQQKTFILSREVGYHLMNLNPRSAIYTSPSVNSFDEILNNFKATYFAGALLLPENDLITDIEAFFGLENWDADHFLNIMYKHNSSPETFFHRLTSILPRYFDLNKLFFIKFTHVPGSGEYNLSKELHLSGLHNPHGTIASEHYCRRWLSVTILNDLEKQMAQNAYNQPICDAQISDYINSVNKYFCITIARPQYPDPNFTTSLTIGFQMDSNFKNKVNFWDAENVNAKIVSETCERCPITNCEERVAPPTILEKRKKEKKVEEDLVQILNE